MAAINMDEDTEAQRVEATRPRWLSALVKELGRELGLSPDIIPSSTLRGASVLKLTMGT